MDHPDSQPIDRFELAEPFVEAVRTALGELAGLEVEVRSVELTVPRRQPDDVSAIVPLYSAHNSNLILTFPGPTATALARRVFAGVLNEPDMNLIRDCVGEVANVIAGQAKSLLAATPRNFRFGVPRTLLGTEPQNWLGESRVELVVFFTTEAGDFSIELAEGASS